MAVIGLFSAKLKLYHSYDVFRQGLINFIATTPLLDRCAVRLYPILACRRRQQDNRHAVVVSKITDER